MNTKHRGGEPRSDRTPGLGFRSVMDHLRLRFLSGVIALLPIGITVIVVVFFFRLLSGLIAPLAKSKLPQINPAVVDFLSFAATLLLIYLLGALSHHVIGRRLFSGVEWLILKIPVLKTVYGSSKQTIDVISSAGRKSPFQSVAICEFPCPGAQALCFVTGTTVDTSTGTSLRRVFIPKSPNPTNGFLLLLPFDKVRSIDMSVEDCIKMLMSGGVLGNATMKAMPFRDEPEAV